MPAIVFNQLTLGGDKPKAILPWNLKVDGTPPGS
jgi:hypothetical protein